MHNIKTSNPQPGILDGLLNFPETAKHLLGLVSVLLGKSSPMLSTLQREIIATTVSMLNNCEFCANSHGAIVALASGQRRIVDQLVNFATGFTTPDHPKLVEMKIILDLAFSVYIKKPDTKLFEQARELGYSEEELHDVVLIVAAFNMYNYYVIGLGDNGLGSKIGDIEPYFMMAEGLIKNGYNLKDPAYENEDVHK
jgi:uncharacterized peroxidase-related enzyme